MVTVIVLNYLLYEIGITGGRGVAGTVFVHKIAGAAAALGKSLDEVLELAREAAESVGTLGVALSTCTVPGAPPSNRLDGALIELGMGIHGEPGREQRTMPSGNAADSIVDDMISTILGGNGHPVRLPLSHNDESVIMVNNLGATPNLEMLIVARRVLLNLKGRGVSVRRAYVGSFMTALEMAGVSISIMKIGSQEMLELLDAATEAPAWVPSPPLSDSNYTTLTYDDVQAVTAKGGPACQERYGL